MSIEHAAESCTTILKTPSAKARDLSLFAKHQGFARLGTWTRDECLSLGKKLSAQDLDCRVVPSFGEEGAHVVPAGDGNVPEEIDVTDVQEITVAVVDVPGQEALLEDTFLLS